MKKIVEFGVAPSIVEWQEALTPRGWKISDSRSDCLHATKEIGQSEFPVKNATTWHIYIDDGDPFTVTVEVPAFTESEYAEKRLLETVEDLVDTLDGTCVISTPTDVDILKTLRQYREPS